MMSIVNSNKVTKVILASIAFATLAGCAARAPQGQFIGYGEIRHVKVVAHTPGQFKTYAKQDAIIGGASGAAIGLAYGVAGGIAIGSASGSIFALLIPGVGPEMAIAGATLGLAAGALVGTAVGASQKYFDKGYVFYRYIVKMDDQQAQTIKAFKFAKFKYPVGSDVSVYGMKEKNNHMFYTIKLLADHDDRQHA